MWDLIIHLSSFEFADKILFKDVDFGFSDKIFQLKGIFLFSQV